MKCVSTKLYTPCLVCKCVALYVDPFNQYKKYCKNHSTKYMVDFRMFCQEKNCNKKTKVRNMHNHWCFTHFKESKKNTCVYKNCLASRYRTNILCTKHILIYFMFKNRRINIKPICLSGYVCNEILCTRNSIYTNENKLLTFCDDHSKYVKNTQPLQNCIHCRMPCIANTNTCGICQVLNKV